MAAELAGAAGAFRPETGAADYVVIDNFLPTEQADAAWAYFSEASFTGAHHQRLQRVFRFYDGEPFMSPGFRRQADENLTETPLPESFRALYETLFVNGSASAFIESTGAWDYVTFQAYIYPVGTGLNWHFDASRSAAFIYYAHPHWEPTWGGELLIAMKGVGGAQPYYPPSADENGVRTFRKFYSGSESAVSREGGCGVFILPVPNRLVLLRGGLAHCIKKVDGSAGEAFRASVSGFFGLD